MSIFSKIFKAIKTVLGIADQAIDVADQGKAVIQALTPKRPSPRPPVIPQGSPLGLKPPPSRK